MTSAIKSPARHLSRKDMADALDAIDAAGRVENAEQLAPVIEMFCAMLPLSAVSVATAQLDPSNSIVRTHQHVAINYSGEWVDLYRRKGYSRIDPVAEHLFRAPAPLIWSELRSRHRASAAKEFYGAAKEFGLNDGFSFGQRFGRSAYASFFTCVGADIAEAQRHRSLLHYLTPHIHAALARTHPSNPQASDELTSRELEVLSWARHGKTNTEISRLLSISSRAVKFHIENAMRKLKALNRTHAISLAMSRGLISWD